MKRKTNFKKISARFSRSYRWWGVLILSFIMMITAVTTMRMEPREAYTAMGIVLLIAAVLLIIGVFLACLFRKHALQRMIGQQGDMESFNQEKFLELGYSEHFFVSENWLIWNRGFEYRIFHRRHTRGAAVHPNQREGNSCGVIDLYTDTAAAPLNLYYKKCANVDLPAMIRGWLRIYGNDRTTGIYEIPQSMPAEKKICAFCQAPNEPEAQYCAWCGSKL